MELRSACSSISTVFSKLSGNRGKQRRCAHPRSFRRKHFRAAITSGRSRTTSLSPVIFVRTPRLSTVSASAIRRPRISTSKLLPTWSVRMPVFLPAVCYHVYHLHENQTLPAQGLVYGICGKCFRYESSNLSDLRWLERGAIDIGKVVVPAEICGGHSAVHDRDEDCGQCNRSRVLAHSS